MANYGKLLDVSGNPPWIQYVFNYTVGNPSPILIFGFRGGNTNFNALDGVSVVDLSAPSVELLRNPSFENSSSFPVGWTQWCQSSCTGTGDRGQVNNTGCRNGSGILCYRSRCNTNADFLGQSFSGILGRTYRISFWLYQSGGSATMTFDIF